MKRLTVMVLVLPMLLFWGTGLAEQKYRTYECTIEGVRMVISRAPNRIVMETEEFVGSGTYTIDSEYAMYIPGEYGTFKVVEENGNLVLDGVCVLNPIGENTYLGEYSYGGMNAYKYYLSIEAETQAYELRVTNYSEIEFHTYNLLDQELNLIETQGMGLLLVCNGDTVLDAYEYSRRGTYSISEEYGEYVITLWMNHGRKIYGTITGITLKVANDTYTKVDEHCYSDGNDYIWLIDGQVFVAETFEDVVSNFNLTENDFLLVTDEDSLQIYEEDGKLYLSVSEELYEFTLVND